MFRSDACWMVNACQYQPEFCSPKKERKPLGTMMETFFFSGSSSLPPFDGSLREVILPDWALHSSRNGFASAVRLS